MLNLFPVQEQEKDEQYGKGEENKWDISPG